MTKCDCGRFKVRGGCYACDEGTNLIDETMEALSSNGKTASDVKYVQTANGSFSWASFCEVGNFKYDSGYGGQEISYSLMIVGENWWMERHEYDGSEWWEFKCMPTKLPEVTPTRTHIRYG